MKIIESLIKIGTKARPGTKHAKKWIVIHETGNTSKGAGAKNHATYLTNLAAANKESLSWHYTVDDKAIYHHVPDDEIAWHASDGRKDDGGNYAGIGIEICINPESDFDAAMASAAELAAKLIKDHGLDINALKQHHDFSPSGKNCPANIRNKGLWPKFKDMVSAHLAAPAKPAPAPAPAPKPQARYKKGDKVTVKAAVLHFDSSGAKPGITVSGEYIITATNPGAKFPYCIGKKAGQYLGWIVAAAIAGAGSDAGPRVYRINDVVAFYGGSHYINSTAAKPAAKNRRAGTAKITNIVAKGAKHPYHLEGITSNVFGWVDLGSFK